MCLLNAFEELLAVNTWHRKVCEDHVVVFEFENAKACSPRSAV
jgi:hypothetical protein